MQFASEKELDRNLEGTYMGIEYELLKNKTRHAHQLSDKAYDTDFKAIFR